MERFNSIPDYELAAKRAAMSDIRAEKKERKVYNRPFPEPGTTYTTVDKLYGNTRGNVYTDIYR